VRIAVLATIAIVGSLWALVRYYTRVPPSMRVPATAQAPQADAGAELIDIETEPPTPAPRAP
jgi:hypothetical protein